MKLNLGCAYNKMEGWVNVDMDPACNPDMLFDVTMPWPLEDNVVDEVNAEHVLEHLEGTQGYLRFWTEMYRVCKPGAEIKIEVPHWQHQTFFHDPTHVRAVTPIGIAMFDQQRNQEDLLAKGRETKLGFMCHVDFAMQGVSYGLDQLTGEPMTCNYMTKVVKPQRYVQ